MQCNHMNEIWSVDKKLVKNSYNDFYTATTPTGKYIYKEVMRYGNDDWDKGVDEYFKSGWNFFNTKPSVASNKKWAQRWMFEMGYYKYNKVGCGQCEICRTEKSKEWAVKANCEKKCWKNACFLTLTYNEPNLEVNNGFINKADMQTFWKKLRYHLYKNTKNAKKIDLKTEYEKMETIPEVIDMKYMISKRKPNKKPIRYIQCNEYGSKKGRAHAHAVIFNFKPEDLRRHARDRRGYWLYTSKKINSIWGHGYVIIADVNANVAAYVARYNTKKFSNISGTVNETIAAINEAYQNEENEKIKTALEKQLKIWKRRRECISASSLGYIGSYYWEQFKEQIIRTGGIFVKWTKGVHLEKIPKPMQKQFEEEYPDEYEMYDMEKCKRGKEQWEKILSNTSLSEEEYIEQTFRQRSKSLRLLKREYNEKPTVQTIFENH